MKGSVTLWLRDNRCMGYDKSHFTVDKMVNTVEWRIGDWLSTEQVNDIINRGVKVHILPPV